MNIFIIKIDTTNHYFKSKDLVSHNFLIVQIQFLTKIKLKVFFFMFGTTES
jgi:hypothetical protein